MWQITGTLPNGKETRTKRVRSFEQASEIAANWEVLESLMDVTWKKV